MKISCPSERIFTCVTSNFLWHPGVHKRPKQCPVLVPSNLHSGLVSGSFCFIQQPLFQENLDKPIPTGKTIVDFNEARDDVVTMATAGLYANYAHFSLTDNHDNTLSLNFLQARCSSLHPTNLPHDWLHKLLTGTVSSGHTIRYDTTWDAILTCAQKHTSQLNLSHRTNN